MGNKSYNFDYYLGLLNQAIARANQPSAVEQAQQTDTANLRRFLTPTGSAPDFRDPQGAGVATGMLPLAEYQRQMQQLSGSPTKDMPGVDPTIAGNQRALTQNQFAQDYGGAYQNRLGQLNGQQPGLANNLMDMVTNRQNLGFWGLQQGLNGLNSRPPGVLGQVIPGLASGIGNAFAGYYGNQNRNSGYHAPATAPGYGVPQGMSHGF